MPANLSTSGRPQYKLYTFFCMLYVVVLAETYTLMFKLISIGAILESGSVLFVPVMYIIEDTIAEVYGYKAARRLIIWSVISMLFFAAMLQFTVHLPSPSYWHHQGSYEFVFGSEIGELVFGSISMIAGELLNIYLITKWKAVFCGKHFWLRSIASTAVGELLQSIIVYSGNFHNLLNIDKVLHLIFSAYLYKMSAAVALVLPAILLIKILKRVEKVDIYDNGTKFNPFNQSSQNSTH